MPPTNSETGNKNFELNTEIGIWNRLQKLGKGFDSSTCFKLPIGSNRSPDISWVKKEKWEALTAEQKKRFAPICPDFVAEIRSNEQDLVELMEKMEEYISSGCELAWLIHPENRITYVYRPSANVEKFAFSQTLSGGDLMPGFEVNLEKLWS